MRTWCPVAGSTNGRVDCASCLFTLSFKDLPNLEEAAVEFRNATTLRVQQAHRLGQYSRTHADRTAAKTSSSYRARQSPAIPAPKREYSWPNGTFAASLMASLFVFAILRSFR